MLIYSTQFAADHFGVFSAFSIYTINADENVSDSSFSFWVIKSDDMVNVCV